MQIVVVPYDPSWPLTFEKLQASIWPAVADHALRIEHVGSTSVPGLAAKPIIDMDIVVASASESGRVIEALTRLGYEHRGDLGIVGRENMKPPEGTSAHHLYVCLHDAESFRNHILLRDRLRSDPEAVRTYSELKLGLAQKFSDDLDSYLEGKTAFITAILEEEGMGAETLERIAAANRKPES